MSTAAQGPSRYVMAMQRYAEVAGEDVDGTGPNLDPTAEGSVPVSSSTMALALEIQKTPIDRPRIHVTKAAPTAASPVPFAGESIHPATRARNEAASMTRRVIETITATTATTARVTAIAAISSLVPVIQTAVLAGQVTAREGRAYEMACEEALVEERKAAAEVGRRAARAAMAAERMAARVGSDPIGMRSTTPSAVVAAAGAAATLHSRVPSTAELEHIAAAHAAAMGPRDLGQVNATLPGVTPSSPSTGPVQVPVSSSNTLLQAAVSAQRAVQVAQEEAARANIPLPAEHAVKKSGDRPLIPVVLTAAAQHAAVVAQADAAAPARGSASEPANGARSDMHRTSTMTLSGTSLPNTGRQVQAGTPSHATRVASAPAASSPVAVQETPAAITPPVLTLAQDAVKTSSDRPPAQADSGITRDPNLVVVKTSGCHCSIQ